MSMEGLSLPASVAAVLVAWVLPAQAGAQTSPEAEQASVAGRARPGIDAQGIDVAGLRAYPSLGITGSYDDNIYNRRSPKVSDGYFRLRPAVRVNSQWSRHSLTLNADAELRRYVERSTENSNQFGIDLAGLYDISPDYRINATGGIARRIEQRGTAGDVLLAGEPTAFYEKSVGLSATATPGRLLFQLSGNAARYDYMDNRRPAGLIDLRLRDYVTYGAQARVGYQIGPNIYAFGSGSVNRSRYPADRAISRDADGMSIGGGVQFGLGPLLGGTVGITYLKQDFASPTFSDVGGLGYTASVFYNPTQLLSVQLTASRTLQRAPVAEAAGIDQSQFMLGADYEVLRRLVVTVTVEYVRSSFRGLDRTENRFVETLSGRYNFNRFFDLTASLNLRQQSATNALRNYSGSALRMGVVARY